MENQNPPFPPPPPQGNPYNQNPYQQNPYQQNPMGNPMGMQQNLPNHGGILALGIISIALCWCYGVIGITCGIIALVLGTKALKQYNDFPNVYSEKSYKNVKAGRICAMIGLSLSILYLIYIICIFIFMGSMITRMPWDSMRHY